jgi:hypothetical protein
LTDLSATSWFIQTFALTLPLPPLLRGPPTPAITMALRFTDLMPLYAAFTRPLYLEMLLLLLKRKKFLRLGSFQISQCRTRGRVVPGAVGLGKKPL